jgi:purine-binding chemotaxis protein CheW
MDMPELNQAPRQFVVFQLLENNYALPVEKVIEVLRMVAVTPLPEAPDWLYGVLNLRGRVIPIMDLRVRLGLPFQIPGLNTPIIVIEAEERPVGLLVDAMREVLTLPEEAITLPDKLANQIHPVKAIARAGGYLALILDLDSLTDGTKSLKIEEFLKENLDTSPPTAQTQ